MGQQLPFFCFYILKISSIVWAHVWIWKFTKKKRINWFEHFVWKWHYGNWRGDKFPKTLSLPNSRGIEKWNSIATNFFRFYFFFLQFHHLCELMCESEHLLEQKKKNFLKTFSVKIALWQVERDKNFQII